MKKCKYVLGPLYTAYMYESELAVEDVNAVFISSNLIEKYNSKGVFYDTLYINFYEYTDIIHIFNDGMFRVYYNKQLPLTDNQFFMFDSNITPPQEVLKLFLPELRLKKFKKILDNNEQDQD